MAASPGQVEKAVLDVGLELNRQVVGDELRRRPGGAFTEAHVDLEALVADALPPAIVMRGLDHVQPAMPAGGEDEATAFYAGLLGLTPVPKPSGWPAGAAAGSSRARSGSTSVSTPSSGPPARPIPPSSSGAWPP